MGGWLVVREEMRCLDVLYWEGCVSQYSLYYHLYTHARTQARRVGGGGPDSIWIRSSTTCCRVVQVGARLFFSLPS